jgi:hypothetical protein
MHRRRRGLRPWLGVILIALSLTSVGAAEVSLHVSPAGDDSQAGTVAAPLKSPGEAVRRLAEIAAQYPDAAVRVTLERGVYRIDEPLTIRPAAVPSRGSLSIAAADQQPVVISGGRRIDGWRVLDDGTWSVAIPEAARGEWTFRELFVSGQRRPRARHPNDGFHRVERPLKDKRSGFTFDAGDLPRNWTGGGELVFLHDWSTSRIPVASVDHALGRLTGAAPIGGRAEQFKIDNFEPHPRYLVESHRSFLDAPGEWLLESSGDLLYRPYPEERPDTVDVVVPRASALLIVQGDSDALIRNVHIEGLRFEHCAWALPSGGYAGVQATHFESPGDASESTQGCCVPSAIQFTLAEDCSFQRGRISQLGTSGVSFGSQTRRCVLQDCVMEDISGNGVNLGEDGSRIVDGRAWWQTTPEQAAAGHVIRHNRIERCGQQFLGAVAIWVGLARGMEITNNEIANHPYTGVSLGWMWNAAPTPAGENLVARNHIHHVMQVLSDGGGIYTLGRQPGTKLLDNVIHHVPLNLGRAESNGMFLDEGSDQMEIAGNTIYGIDRSPLRFHRAEQMTVRDNTLVLASQDAPAIRYNSTNPDTIRQVDNRVIPQTEFDPTAVELPVTGPR